MATLINLTPHDIHVVEPDGTPIATIPRSGAELRLEEIREQVGVIRLDGLTATPRYVALNQTWYGPADVLPDQQPNTCYIVSRLVADLVKRADFIVPDQMVRDGTGTIVGCCAFAR